MAPRHGGVDAVGRDALDRVGGGLHRGGQELPDRRGRALAARGPRPAAALGGLPTPMRTRRKSFEWRCVGDGAQPVVAGESAARLQPDRPGRQVELVVHDDDGRGIGDAEALRQARARRDRTRSCTWSARPAPPACRPASTTPTRAGTPFSARRVAPWRSASSVDGIGPGVVQAPGEFAPLDSPSPTTSRSAGVPRRSDRAKGAAQGLALSARALGCLPGRLGGLARCPFLALALGALALGGDDAGRLADGDRRLGVDVGGDARQAARCPTPAPAHRWSAR